MSGEGLDKQVRRFGTMTRDLLELSDWLTGNGVTYVEMESRLLETCWEHFGSRLPYCWSMHNV